VENKMQLSLLCRVRGATCAIPLADVLECMRPLPLESLTGAPTFVLGAALIRGLPVPVLDLGALLGGTPVRAERWVTLKVGERSVALAVDAVVGIQPLAGDALAELPPLLRDAGSALVAALGSKDQELLLVLQHARVLGEGSWARHVPEELAS
jgi:purine-binding chemotaxis protein CheW